LASLKSMAEFSRKNSGFWTPASRATAGAGRRDGHTTDLYGPSHVGLEADDVREGRAPSDGDILSTHRKTRSRGETSRLNDP
jgi:hypothetical protein